MVPLWPNGESIGLLSQGLWVQVPPGVGVFFAMLESDIGIVF